MTKKKKKKKEKRKEKKKHWTKRKMSDRSNMGETKFLHLYLCLIQPT
jgi:hypothetical protein